MKVKYVLIIFFCIFFFSFIDIISGTDGYFVNSNELVSENVSFIIDEFKYQEDSRVFANVFFCREINCEELFLEVFGYVHESVYCAFFDFKLDNMITKLHEISEKNKEVIVLVDRGNDFFKKEDYDFLFFDRRSSFMHNKFCLINDDILITGSFNPTFNGRDKNENNVLVIQDRDLVKVYNEYFFKLFNESVNPDYRHSRENRNFNVKNVEVCFSRGGNCLNVIKDYLIKSNESIYFMTFSFTDNDIESLLLYKKEFDNVSVSGIFDRTLITRHSTYHKLFFQLSNNSIIRDCSSGKMHHKVFIIDSKIVITGSFNPSNNADRNNDENLIIIKDVEIAEKYIKEYERIRLLCMM